MLIDWVENCRERNRDQVMEYLVKTIKDSLTGILNQTVDKVYM